METRDLEFILAIHAHGGIGRAAAALGITQPALTKAVKRLEAEVGLRLFERSARGMSPTSAGALFIERIRAIHRDYEDVLTQMRAIQSGTQGILSLGYSPSVSDAIVLDACRQLILDRPAAQIRLRRMLAPDLLDLLTEGSLDLVVAPVPKQRAEEFVVRELFTDVLTVIADEKHPLLRKRKPKLADLIGHDWLLPGSHVAVRQHVEAAFRKQNLPPPVLRIETDFSSRSFIHLVRNTKLLSIASAAPKLMTEGIRSIRLDPQELDLRRQIAIMSRAGAYMSPLAQRMISIVEQHSRRVRPTWRGRSE
ncbi:LysR family transcriptional regulator [Paraburkholderia diazotrophica]|uniref:Transcriptional regulator, LysR family n=1 Tax=Paraburkholderia diazotrophica TaxID=667676 RepID=A0A1H7EIC1_9BURK|nr:LysR family transcriptional regulator [Paraburkholderia diazotrophica]SEK11772.1 transcriptional regulator, LysR family [Paraburkholderia diazotrophica]